MKSWPRQRDQQHHGLAIFEERKEVHAAGAQGQLEMSKTGGPWQMQSLLDWQVGCMGMCDPSQEAGRSRGCCCCHPSERLG